MCVSVYLNLSSCSACITSLHSFIYPLLTLSSVSCKRVCASRSSCISCISMSRLLLWPRSSVFPLELGGPPGAPVMLLDPEVALEQSSSLSNLGLDCRCRAAAPSSASSGPSLSTLMLSALPKRWRISEAISRGLEATAPAAECRLSTTPSLRPVMTRAPTSLSPCCISRSTSLGCRCTPLCSVSRRRRW